MTDYRYDTQLLIEGCRVDRDQLIELIEKTKGDSLLVVGDEELMKVHYHTNQPWETLKTCAGTGEIFDIVVEDMIRQANGQQG
ncbi:MAG: kinase to dihydroxyacetone kinase [Clostridia bacterium]|nr:kinase to dihydroxyacetone kinase [Clostridia bacterium]